MSSEADLESEKLERQRRREERRRKREAERAAQQAEDAQTNGDVEITPSPTRRSTFGEENFTTKVTVETNQYNGQSELGIQDARKVDQQKENRRRSSSNFGLRKSSPCIVWTQASIKLGEESDGKNELAEITEWRKQEQERKERQLLEEREAQRQKDKEEWEELKQRRERRLREREAEEKARQEREKEMQKKAEEEARLRKEAEEHRKAELAEKRKNQENTNKGIALIASHFSLKENIRRAKEDARKSKGELAEEKESVLDERIPPLQTGGSKREMKDHAIELYRHLEEVLSQVYDLKQRRQRQDYDLNELAQRLDVMKNTSNKPKLLGQVGRVSRIKDFISEDKNSNTPSPKSRFQRQREEGSIGKGGVRGRLAMFETKDTTPTPVNNNNNNRQKPPPLVKLY